MTFRMVTAMIAALGLSAAAAVPAAAAPAAEYTRAEFQSDLDHLNELGVTGVQGRVVLADGTVWTATSGVADVRTGRPVPAAGYYRIASNTKTFVATVVLQLVAEGELSLEDSVEEHLPGVVPGGSAITVRNLLQHTSGLYDYQNALPGSSGAEDFERHRFDHHEAEDLVALAVNHPPDFPPGTDFRYSNTGYVLAGMIVESVTGRSWGEEVEQRIIRPLGLKHTSVPGDFPFLPWPHARAYQQWGLGTPGTDTTTFNPTRSDAAGGMVSTTADLGRFFRELLAGRLLPPELMEEMRTTVAVEPGGVELGYGLGLYEKGLSCGGSYWDHGGNTAGVISRGGVSVSGDVSVALVFTGAAPDSMEDLVAMQRVSEEVVDRVFCG